MKKTIAKLIEAILSVCLLATNITSLTAQAETKEAAKEKTAKEKAEEKSSKGEDKEESEYADQEVFLAGLAEIFAISDEDFLAAAEADNEEALEGILSDKELVKAVMEYEGDNQFVLLQKLALKDFENVIFEDEELTALADEYFSGINAILRSDKIEDNKRYQELILSAGMIMYCSSVYEINDKYDAGMDEEDITELNEVLDSLWFFLGSGDMDDAAIEEVEGSTETAEKVEAIEEETDVAAYTLPENLEVEADYTYSSYGYTYYFIIVKNNSKDDLSVKAEATSYGEDGEVSAFKTNDITVLAPDSSYVLEFLFSEDEPVNSLETEITASKVKYYKAGYNDLSYELKKVKKGAVVKMTNEGKSAIDFPEGTLLFLKDGQLVGSTNTFFTDDDYELKPGDTITKEMTMYSGEFDELKFYYTGRIDKE